MYNLPNEPINEHAAEASLSASGYHFQTRSVPPPMWGSVTGYGTDHIPWWIQREMLEKKDRKIKRLEAQAEKYKKEIEQQEIQLQSYKAKFATIPNEPKQPVIPSGLITQDYANITERCITSINKLDVLLRRVEELQRHIVDVNTTPNTRFIILKLEELEELGAV